MSSHAQNQRHAEDRETALLVHQHYVASTFKAGEAKERRETVRVACELLRIEIDDARESLLSSLDLDRLGLVVQKLKTERRWPEAL